jgi:hypothetical protein
VKKSNHKTELDVDFIESKPLSKEEEKALSEFIKKLKSKKHNHKKAA